MSEISSRKDTLPEGYAGWLVELKARIQSARLQASFAVNQELLNVYWQIGSDILNRQNMQGWGTGVIPRLAKDLRSAFPEMKGFSPRNLGYMRSFAAAWPDESILQGVLAKLPWYHHVALLDKLADADTRLWYAAKAVENGWSRNTLVLQIETNAHQRLGNATSNFALRLPESDSDLAQQTLKDPYIFDFLTLDTGFRARELEVGLISHLEKFLLELGQGFAFVGRQYHLDIGDQDFYIDLLFYHLELRCFVVIDLKRGDFKPEYAGKMNFYCSVVDEQLRHKGDKPTIGLILCQQPNRVLAEYALRGMDKPIGVSGFELTRALPTDLQSSLPTIEELERELEGGVE